MCRVVTRPEEIVSTMRHNLVECTLYSFFRYITSIASSSKLTGLDGSKASFRLFSTAVDKSTVGSCTLLILVVHVGVGKLDESDGLAFVLVQSDHVIKPVDGIVISDWLVSHDSSDIILKADCLVLGLAYLDDLTAEVVRSEDKALESLKESLRLKIRPILVLEIQLSHLSHKVAAEGWVYDCHGSLARVT